MSVGSDIHEEPGPLAPPTGRHTTFPCELVPYVLATADAAIIVLSSLIGGTLYQWSDWESDAKFAAALRGWAAGKLYSHLED